MLDSTALHCATLFYTPAIRILPVTSLSDPTFLLCNLISLPFFPTFLDCLVAAHTAAQVEIAGLREEVLISRTYAEGLLVQLGELRDRDREREREWEKVQQGDRRGQGDEGDRRGGVYSAERNRAKSPYHQSKQPHPMSASSVTLAATRPYSHPSQSPSSYTSSSSAQSQSQSHSHRPSNLQTPYSSQSQSQSLSHSQPYTDSNLTCNTAPAWHRSKTTSPPQTLPLHPYLSQSSQSFQTLEDILDDDYDKRNAVLSGQSAQLQGVQGVPGSSSEYSQSSKNRLSQV